eukprot:Partr_v1_DN26702_c0_g1_i4_m9122 putative Baculoviral IAP repeat containing
MVEHTSHSSSCPLVVLHLSTAEGAGGKKRKPPTARQLEAARLKTFANWWPHESVKSISSKVMAKAGMVYAPTSDSDDCVRCFRCQLTLDGWESGDDPVEEHFKRSPNCPFFAGKKVSAGAATDKKSSAKSKRASSRRRISDESGDLSIVSDVSTIADASMVSNASTASSAVRRSTRRNKAQVVQDESTIMEDLSMVSAVSSVLDTGSKRKRGRKPKEDAEFEAILDPAILDAPLLPDDINTVNLELENHAEKEIPAPRKTRAAAKVHVDSFKAEVTTKKVGKRAKVTADEAKVTRPKRGRPKKAEVSVTEEDVEAVAESFVSASNVMDTVQVKEVVEPTTAAQPLEPDTNVVAEPEFVKDQNIDVPPVEEPAQLDEMIFSDSGSDLLTAEEIETLTVEQVLRKLHDAQVMKLTAATGQQIDEFIKFYNHQIDQFKSRIQIAD